MAVQTKRNVKPKANSRAFSPRATMQSLFESQILISSLDIFFIKNKFWNLNNNSTANLEFSAYLRITGCIPFPRNSCWTDMRKKSYDIWPT
jgi:hypothetical protein